MVQPQRPADVHQDELCPPNKRYALMDANKKIDLDNSLYPNESKIIANIIQNHPLRFSVAASLSVPWIYLGIFHLPQDTDNNHERFVAAQKFSEMVPFFLNTHGHYMTAFPEISRRARDKYHNLEDDVMVKNILNSGKHKDDVGMKIPSWMITDEMKLTDHYRMLEPRSDKESPEVEITVELQPVNINEDEEESAEDDYELKRKEKGKHVEESRSTPSPIIIRSPRTHTTLISLNTKKEIMEESLPTMVDDRVMELTKKQVPLYVAEVLIMEREKSQTDVAKMIADAIQQEREILQSEISSQINDAISNHIPSQDDLPIWLALKYKFERLYVATTPCRPSVIRPRDHDNPYDDSHPEGENSAKRHKTSMHGTFVFGESSSGQDFESKPCPSMSGNQEQLDDFDFWTDSYATDDDEIPNEKVSQELVDELSYTVDEAKLRKAVDEIFTPFTKSTPVVQSCQRDPKAHVLSLVNQDLLYLKKGSSGPEKFVMSLHKFPAVIFLKETIKKNPLLTRKMAPMALSDSELNYKKGLASVKEQLVFYIKNEVIFGDKIAVLKRDVSFKHLDISWLKSELEKVKLEKESYQLKIKNFENASKRFFYPPKIDLSNSGLEEFQEPEFEGYGPKTSKSASEDISNEVRKSNDAPLVEKLVSDDKSEKKLRNYQEESFTYKEEMDPMALSDFEIDLSNFSLEEFQKPEFEGYGPKTSKSASEDISNEIEFVKSKQQEKPVRKPVKYAEMYMSQKPRGNQRNWNNKKSQQLGNDFVMHNKACYVCGSFDHLQYTCKQKRQLNGQWEEKPVWNNARRVNHQNSPRITHPNSKRHMVPRKILTRSGPISLNTARQSHFNVVGTNRVNAVKASACWVWRPIKPNSASITLKRYDYVDVRGRSRRNYQEESFTHKEEMAPMALSDSESNLANYKRGLASVEEQLVFYRKNEVIFGDKIVVLKRDVSFKDSDISWLKSELEKVKLEKESYQLKIENFENASKRLVQNIPSSTLYVPPTKNDWETLFQPMFDEYLNPPPCVDP
ncbi:hypothetical protein Tco_1428793 [Tanacetum coccineum]